MPDKEEGLPEEAGSPRSFTRDGEKDVGDNAPPSSAGQLWIDHRENPQPVGTRDGKDLQGFECILCGVVFYRKRPSDQFCHQCDEWEGGGE